MDNSITPNVGLVTGVSGQDGQYMAEYLLARDYQVIGVTRSIDAARKDISKALSDSIQLIEWNPSCQTSIEKILRKYKPTEVFNFAAYSRGSGMYDDPVSIAEINGVTVTRILEAIRTIDPSIRLCQASSREIFGEALASPQTESTQRLPRSSYGAAKLYADTMIRIYRDHYGVFGASAILYNHESPRRSESFVTRKITRAVARIKLGLQQTLPLGNLETTRDWGFAEDYVRAMWLMLQESHPNDYVISTGRLHSVRELCQIAFSSVGLDYRDYVRTQTNLFRTSEPFPLVGDSSKAKLLLGWTPQIAFEDLIRSMVQHDLDLLNKGRS